MCNVLFLNIVRMVSLPSRPIHAAKPRYMPNTCIVHTGSVETRRGPKRVTYHAQNILVETFFFVGLCIMFLKYCACSMFSFKAHQCQKTPLHAQYMYCASRQCSSMEGT